MSCFIRNLILSFLTAALLLPSNSTAVAQTYQYDVQPVRVCNDAGADCTDLGPLGGTDTSYLYSTQIDTIWTQADITVNLLPVVQWNNTEAQRLTGTERSQIYAGTFPAGTGDALPPLPTDAAQVFFVMDHPGTGYDGTTGSGWVGTPLVNPTSMARNAGNAQLGIVGFTSNARSVMANEGFSGDSLSGTLAHELGHVLGLRHVNSPDTPQPGEVIADTTIPNLMWAGGEGPDFNGGLSLQANFDLTPNQISLAVSNGLALDPDGNGTGVLRLVPEPDSYMLTLVMLGIAVSGFRRRLRVVRRNRPTA